MFQKKFLSQKYFIGNWKMNMDLLSIKNFFVETTKIGQLNKQEHILALCPQFIHIPIVKDFAFTIGNFLIGSQNVASYQEGAYTGEVSAKALKNLGIDFSLIGHSERRHLLGETNESCLAKIKNCFLENIPVLLCIGETKEQKDQQKTKQVLFSQLQNILENDDNKSLISQNNFALAYEPVWSIGTGLVASVEEIEEILFFLKETTKKYLGFYPTLLYGGSVSTKNFQEFLSGASSVDGLLIGGASLSGANFLQFVSSSSVKGDSSFSL